MKRLIPVFALVLMGLAGCKGFLDREPLSEIAPDQFFTSESDLRLYTNSFYNVIPSAEDIYNEDIDNIVKTTLPDAVTGRRTVPTSGGGWDWGELRKINYFLGNYNRQGLSSATTNKYVGLAKFFRAWFYFNKVVRFGDVPWYNRVINTTDEAYLTQARDPRTVVMDSVLADINDAVARLATTKATEEVTKWTALALKSRICLFEGTFRKYHTEFNLPNADKFLNEAVTASEELMTKSGYQIYSTSPDLAYRDLFASLKASPEEVILARKFSSDLQVFHNVNYYTITASYGKPGLEKRLVNSYLMKDGSRFTDRPNYNTLPFYEEIQNRDPRLAQTIRTPGYTRIGNTNKLVPDFGATVTGYQLTKFVTAETEDSYNKSLNDMPVFRYAEVLLNYAEAKAELGTLTQSDLDKSIQLIRKRVAMPALELAKANADVDPYLAAQYTHVSGANRGVLLEIRRERRIELVMESYRWNDLMRWKEGHLVADQFKGMYFPGLGKYDLDNNGTTDVVIYEGTKPTEKGPQYLKLGSEVVLEGGKNGGLVLINSNQTKSFNENRDYLYPIPIQERLLNKNLTQNPGWQDGL
ncbi:RagB/SusD family nutrient uptake outer membrane protein [Siphonobacter sp. BAB-5405]|uniref:RagB/SusD family nutrient uptake outer membrane protein n=1 Tax=Siphonobacter sp. BAB-5405 TaxID=1864825 RepID=UPI000C8044FE|nr:RagB/SusD family nutrient uptake outer membrane protein [Siphonobacter sp. BAB-5405]PMD91676.1 RagB/SusD family nutrient uptake outer membrane protein [Siphonobacter sp. BAB-5405]